MSSAKYTRLPTTEKFEEHDIPSPSTSRPISRSSSLDSYSELDLDVENRPRRRRQQEPLPAFDSDPRFRVEKPSPWARAALVGFMLFMFFLAFRMRRALWLILLESEGVSESDPDSWGM